MSRGVFTVFYQVQWCNFDEHQFMTDQNMGRYLKIGQLFKMIEVLSARTSQAWVPSVVPVAKATVYLQYVVGSSRLYYVMGRTSSAGA
jgi:hypothetical protein